MYDRIKDLLIGESNTIPTRRPGESAEAYKARRDAWVASTSERGHAEMKDPSRESGSKEDIERTVRGPRR